MTILLQWKNNGKDACLDKALELAQTIKNTTYGSLIEVKDNALLGLATQIAIDALGEMPGSDACTRSPKMPRVHDGMCFREAADMARTLVDENQRELKWGGLNVEKDNHPEISAAASSFAFAKYKSCVAAKKR